MLDLGLPRALVLSTLTLAATFAAGSAQADPPPPPALPAPTAPAPAAAPPEAKPDSAAVPAATKTPTSPGHVYSPPSFDLGYTSPVDGTLPFERQPTYPPEMQMRSAGMVAGGVVLLSFGVVGLFAGSAMVGAHEPIVDQPNTCFDCGFEDSSGGGSSTSSNVVLKPGFKTAGIATLIGSTVAIGAAIPLIVIGAKKVPYADTKAAKLTPSLHVGPANATVVWQF